MISRMLLVFLLVLNLGVAAWWALHRPAPPVREATVDTSVPTLDLLRPDAAVTPEPDIEAATSTPASTSFRAAPAETPASNDAPVNDTVCASFGPFADQAAAQAAAGRLSMPGMKSAPRRIGSANARGYNVVMPPLENRETALAMVDRLRAAGFNDLMLMANGDAANGIALGRFGSEANARSHQSALQAKGFVTHVLPVGGNAVYWLDVRAPAGFDANAQRTRIGAAQVQARTCSV